MNVKVISFLTFKSVTFIREMKLYFNSIVLNIKMLLKLFEQVPFSVPKTQHQLGYR